MIWRDKNMCVSSQSQIDRKYNRQKQKETMAGTGKCFLVTGPPGVGKSTLIMRVLESLRLNSSIKLQGFYTREVRRAGQRVGFEVVTLDGRTAPLASLHFSSPESVGWPSVGKYKVDVASFESLALPELQVREDTSLFIIDEVGKMELFSSSFFPAVLRVLESNIPVLASIPIPKFGRDIPEVARLRNHAGATCFTLNVGNRDAVREQIRSLLEDLLIKH
ncbi:cancer-related nucleoside-triphosphatase-like [Vigna umbellata]|uniref:cancer-related nucleoside-triphosphatase-like n=1 Tax=Vigna umbellata TaxID=87088 RepID=UPI001F5EB4AC|nr:cancer-related nucleoside-triphosphatase-like [Vigna umbellata]XP_047169210.1 cancer-related nucleoside-triphosphatase-like [Vigna umbellata]